MGNLKAFNNSIGRIFYSRTHIKQSEERGFSSEEGIAEEDEEEDKVEHPLHKDEKIHNFVAKHIIPG